MRRRFEVTGLLECRCRVVYVDPDLRSPASAADQNAPSRFGIFDGIGYEVVQNAAEQQGITDHTGFCVERPNVYSSLNGGILVFVSQLPEQWPKPDGRYLQRIDMFSQVKGIHQTIELLGQLRGRPLSSIKPCLLWHLLQT